MDLSVWLGMLHDRIIPWHMRLTIDHLFMKIPKKYYLPPKLGPNKIAPAKVKANLIDID